MNRIFVATAALAALGLTGCYTDHRPDKTEIEQRLRENEAKWNRAFAAHDSEALASLYADDAALANPGAPLVTGKEAIAKETAAFAADPNLKIEFAADRIQVARSGELAYARGHYTLTMTDAATRRPQSSTGNYLTVWKRQPDGGWKVVEDFITPGPARGDE